ncbi:class I mannose-6-phosphate isomerase [Algibacter pacificus]|uniref:class I mannose-6-phosphate isomerase n=1 Tax=Algibacter pacificus TaxID=2599389 RepID=UPI0011C779AA|nr:class I mannose-6-phosphate isomerase [Algibacter pacificus]
MNRETSQKLLPVVSNKPNKSTYNLNPIHKLVEGQIAVGYNSLASRLKSEKTIIIDGYVGVDWIEIVNNLTAILKSNGFTVSTYNIQECLKPENELNNIVAPYLNGDDPVFGKKTDLKLLDYFEKEKLANVKLENNADIQIVYGTGAALSSIKGCLVYVDLPKNELQYRMRANAITNLGFSKLKPHKQMYKHFYFVDWVVLNEEKKKLLPKFDIIIDQQRPEEPTWTEGEALRKSLTNISQNFFRVRPWFEPGVWGGNWIKEHIEGLNPNVPNYAWSFEMIVPENGLIFGDQNGWLEVSFDMLMFLEHKNVLGNAANRFKYDFPIRYDFLDTYDGGNLSVQCHPKPEYIKTEFGENFTQDETYYILDAENDAEVYLGFQEDINPEEFKTALDNSYQTKAELDVEKYVQKMPAKKHDLFLIPHGTVHCSGINNMVLEISATPYIYTFKMYDWQRLDLEGNPRPLNIERAFKNLNFNRKGTVVQDTLISKPTVEAQGEGWEKIHLPTHPDHFYDVYRYEFDDEVEIETKNQCHILMLVEGTAVELSVASQQQTFYYAETFAVPAATQKYRLKNKGNSKAKVVVTFVKEDAC